ncbi:MAG: universal stress protein [Anaerolineae bacterium]|jgi:nucleotide-binding universal stress UspA family protein
MANQILVPLDGSPLAEQALPYATMLAQKLPAELVLLRAVSLPTDIREILDQNGVLVDAPLKQLHAEAYDYLRQVVGQLEEAGLRVHPVVRHEPAAEAIVDYAENADVQQIVMATHGYSGVSRWAHGSVAERVLQLARVPLFLVRARGEERIASPALLACRRILAPLDGSTMAEQVLPPLTLVAQAFDAEVILFQVSRVQVSELLAGDWYLPIRDALETARQEAQAYLDRVADGLRAQGVKAGTAMRVGQVADSIIDYARINRVDLIAMCTHGRTGLARWALGSVADRVLRASHVPIFLVRAGQRASN